MRTKSGRYVILRHRRGDDPRLRGLSLRASGLLLRLMMSRSCSSFGSIPGGRKALTEECGVDEKEFAEAFGELEKAKLALADWARRLVFITFMAEDDPPSNDSVAIGRGRMLVDLPECDLRRQILATCFRHSGVFADKFQNAVESIGGVDVDEPLDDDGIVPRPARSRA